MDVFVYLSYSISSARPAQVFNTMIFFPVPRQYSPRQRGQTLLDFDDLHAGSMSPVTPARYASACRKCFFRNGSSLSIRLPFRQLRATASPDRIIPQRRVRAKRLSSGGGTARQEQDPRAGLRWPLR